MRLREFDLESFSPKKQTKIAQHVCKNERITMEKQYELLYPDKTLFRYQNQNAVCDVCDEVLDYQENPEQYFYHARQSHSEIVKSLWYKGCCEICKLTFPTLEILKSHQEKCVRKRTCNFCLKKYTNMTILNGHIGKCPYNPKNQNNTNRQCSLCDFSCDNSIDFNLHMTQNHRFRDKNRMNCPFCPETFAILKNWRDHIKNCPYKKKKNSETSPTNESLKNTEMTPPGAPVTFDKMAKQVEFVQNNSAAYQENFPSLTSIASEKPSQKLLHFQCTYCTERFQNFTLLCVHARTFHSELVESSWLLCSNCPLRFPDKESLSYHSRNCEQKDELMVKASILY